MAYFSNSKFDKLFVARASLADGSHKRISIESQMASMVNAMVENYARHPFYARYPEAFRQDMTQEGVIAIWTKVDGFDRTKGTNYFAYFTSVARNAFIGQLREYYKSKNKSIPLEVMENFLAEDE